METVTSVRIATCVDIPSERTGSCYDEYVVRGWIDVVNNSHLTRRQAFQTGLYVVSLDMDMDMM